MTVAEASPDVVAVPILCEAFKVCLRPGAEGSELLVTADVLHLEKSSDGLSIQIGALDLQLQQNGVMELKEMPNGWGLLFPHSSEETFVIQIYPREGDAEKLEAILSTFRQLKTMTPEVEVVAKPEEYESQTANTIKTSGVWLATKLIQAGDKASAWIKRKGEDKAQNAETKEVAVSEGTQKALKDAKTGAEHILKWTRVGVSFASATFKLVGGKMAEVTRKTGALDKLKPDKDQKNGRVCMEVGMASVDAILDVYHAMKKAADVVTDQTERTAVQVAGDLYGEEVREAAKSGVGAVMDVGRAGAKILQVAGDEVDLCLQIATEYADHAVTMDMIMEETPIKEGKMTRRDPITFKWSLRFASLSNFGLLLFTDEATMLARDAKRPPANMIGADDFYSIEAAGLGVESSLKIRTRDHVMHEFLINAEDRDEWLESLIKVQKGSHRYKVLQTQESDVGKNLEHPGQGAEARTESAVVDPFLLNAKVDSKVGDGYDMKV